MVVEELEELQKQECLAKTLGQEDQQHRCSSEQHQLPSTETRSTFSPGLMVEGNRTPAMHVEVIMNVGTIKKYT